MTNNHLPSRFRRSGGVLKRATEGVNRPVIEATLEDNSFTDSGMEILQNLTELRAISLKRNREISDQALRHLRGLKKANPV